MTKKTCPLQQEVYKEYPRYTGPEPCTEDNCEWWYKEGKACVLHRIAHAIESVARSLDGSMP